jgi:hypothetical protein
VWVKPHTVSGTQGIITKEYGDNAHPYQVRLQNDEITFGFYSDAIGWNPVTTTDANLVAGGWVHIACTYDMDTAKIYVNGVLKAAEHFTFAIPTNNQQFEIGRTSDGGFVYLHGEIDEVRVWNIVRTQQEAWWDISSSTNRTELFSITLLLPVMERSSTSISTPIADGCRVLRRCRWS